MNFHTIYIQSIIYLKYVVYFKENHYICLRFRLITGAAKRIISILA